MKAEFKPKSESTGVCLSFVYLKLFELTLTELTVEKQRKLKNFFGINGENTFYYSREKTI